MKENKKPKFRMASVEPTSELAQMLECLGAVIPEDVLVCIQHELGAKTGSGAAEVEQTGCPGSNNCCENAEVDQRGCRSHGDNAQENKDSLLIIERVSRHFEKMQRQYAELMPKIARYESMSYGFYFADFPTAYQIVPLITSLERLVLLANVMEEEMLFVSENTRHQSASEFAFQQILSDLRFWRDGVSGALFRLRETYVSAAYGNRDVEDN